MAVYEPSEPTVEVTADGRVTPAMPDQLTEVTVGVRFLNQQRPVSIAFLPARPDFVWRPPADDVSDRSDGDRSRARRTARSTRSVFAKLQRLRINPSNVCDDATFVRRVFLDLNGLIPTAAEARAFVESDDPDKRAKLIDELLERQEFADWWTLKWADLLRNEEKALDRKGMAGFQAWIRSAIGGGMPMNEFARELLSSHGSTYASPAANYYRAMRDPIMRAESAAQVFLGIRLQCAKCHNHPFDRWTQDDYYGWANVFARVDYKVLENNRRDGNDKHEFNGEQIVYQKPNGGVEDPRTGEPVDPRLLVGMMESRGIGTAGTECRSVRRRTDGVRRSDWNGQSVRTTDWPTIRSPTLADWIADPANRQFARVQVNRIWAELMGRGLVEPVDDFRGTNPATHPELLEWLTEDFIVHGYDLRHTIRTICNSQTYQLSATPTADERPGRAELLAHARSPVDGRATARQSEPRTGRAAGVQQLSGRPACRPTSRLVRRVSALWPTVGRERVSQRVRQTTAVAVLLVRTLAGDDTGPIVPTHQRPAAARDDHRGAAASNRSHVDADHTGSQVIEELYWSLLTEKPDGRRAIGMETLLTATNNRRTTLEDVAWALLNSCEFLLRR